jgi:adenylate cyclase
MGRRVGLKDGTRPGLRGRALAGYAASEGEGDDRSGIVGRGGRVVLSLFDGVSLARQGRLLKISSRKSQALLAFLALGAPQSGVSRERLCGLLWSESSEDKARASLRQALHELKLVLDLEVPGLLQAGRDMVGLSGGLMTDVADLIERLRGKEIHPGLLGRKELTGSLLLGFDDLDPSFRAWLVVQRQAVHQEVTRGLERILRQEMAPPESRGEAAEALLNLEPTHEEACRYVMHDAASRGDLAGALKIYKRLWDLVEEEFGSEPSEQTKALAVQLKMHALPTPAIVPNVGVQASQQIPSLAVLPFSNFSGDPEQEYLVDGIVEDITTALSRIRWFFVMARNSSFTYKGKAVDVREVSRNLGVRYVLEGSLKRAGPRLRVTAQLIDGSTGHHVWAECYDGLSEDIFAFQDGITESVVGALEPSVRRAEIDRANRKPTGSLAAYDCLLRAMPLVAVADKPSIQKAQELLSRALAIDPKYAHAMSLQARCCAVLVSQNWGSERESRRGAEYARQAITYGQDDPLALAEAAVNLAHLARDYPAALDAVERSLKLHPASASTHNKAGWLRVYVEEPTRATHHFETAIRLSPVDLAMCHFLTGKATACLVAHRWEDAYYCASKAVALNGGWGSAHRTCVVALVMLGRLEEARAAAQRVLEISPGFRLSEHMKHSPFRSEAIWQLALECMRKAGLPE